MWPTFCSQSSAFSQLRRFHGYRRLRSDSWVGHGFTGCGKTLIYAGFGKGTTSVVPFSRLDLFALQRPRSAFCPLNDFFRSLLGPSDESQTRVEPAQKLISTGPYRIRAPSHVLGHLCNVAVHAFGARLVLCPACLRSRHPVSRSPPAQRRKGSAPRTTRLLRILPPHPPPARPLLLVELAWADTRMGQMWNLLNLALTDGSPSPERRASAHRDCKDQESADGEKRESSESCAPSTAILDSRDDVIQSTGTRLARHHSVNGG